MRVQTQVTKRCDPRRWRLDAGIPCCRVSNGLKRQRTHATTQRTGQTTEQTDRRIAALIYVPTVGRVDTNAQALVQGIGLYQEEEASGVRDGGNLLQEVAVDLH